MTKHLQASIVEIASVRRRFGYRRIHEGWSMDFASDSLSTGRLTFMAWEQTHGIRHITIEPRRSFQNGYVFQPRTCSI
jgi:hypothetical protein